MCKKIIFLAVVLLSLHRPVFSQFSEDSERILLFESDIVVNEDGSMQVTETIMVESTGNQIKHGIYRDFPTRYKDRLGNNYLVDFTVTKVLRDDIREDYFLNDLVNGKRVYIGKKDLVLEPGRYTYALTYTTNRQLGFFKDFDELYWNVTGNSWAFPIEKVRATVTLPDGAGRSILNTDGYTGFQGAQGKDFISEVDFNGDAIFTSTRPLQPKEGLTIAVSWPKGFVKEPDMQQKFNYFLKDNRSVLFGLLGLLLVTGYYLVLWALVGKDPAKGTIIPRYHPPEKLDPAAMRYIMKMGYDNKAFTSSIINMAVKKFLTIREHEGKYILEKITKDQTVLSQGETLMSRQLFSHSNTMRLENTNHERINRAIVSLKLYLKNQFEKVYFFTHTQYFVAGALLSLLVIVMSTALGDTEKLPIAIFMSMWLAIWSVGVTFLLKRVLALWKMAFVDKSHRAVFTGKAIFITLFAIPFVLGEIFGIGVLAGAASGTILLLLLATVFLNVLFYHLLKAPTLMGRIIMDQIEGFKMYLSTAEKDRLNILNPPEKTPELFEEYLPYALALDVEQQWAEQFNDIFEKAAAAGQEYSPHWYSGAAWSTRGTVGFASGLGSSFSTAVSSSSTPPGSSSGSGGGSGGGGGGSSGGGGGGGGGGGW